MSGALTILRAHDGRRLAKAFEVASIGTVTRRDYDSATWFAAESVPLAGIHDLHRLLLRLESDPGACVIRGEAAPETDRDRTRRNKAAFPEAPRRWAMFDCDGIPLPPGSSVLADPAEAARALLDLLAAHGPELEGVSAVVQFSSSAGLDEVAEGEALAGIERPGRWDGVARPGLSAHVWFWLRDALGEAELTRWAAAINARAGCKLIDPATVRTVQPHYTAAPIFAAPLRDPLAGCRTLLVEGAEDAAELRIPAEHARQAAGEGVGAAEAGRGYAAYLAGIGGPEGFRGPIMQAVASFVGANWPAPDLAAMKAGIRARIAAADPGGRPAAVLWEYASDRHLGHMAAWAMQREAGKRAERQAEAERPVAPTFPDRGVALPLAEHRAAAAVARFGRRLCQGEAPEMLLRLSVGGGKSEAAIAGADGLLTAAHAGGREGGLFYLVPRHDLGGEVVDRIKAAHPGQAVAVWRGMDQADPEAPGEQMCRDPELPRLAAAAGLSGTTACAACPLRAGCGYWRQRRQGAGIWVAAHNLAFQGKPSGLPPAAAVVFDEAFWPAGLAGTDAPVQLAVSALAEERTGAIRGVSRRRLLELRRLMAAALAETGEGAIARAPFEALAITKASAEEWQRLEWMTEPAPGLAEGMPRDAIAERLREAAGSGFTRLRPMLARFVAALLAGTDARSVNAELVRNADLGRGQGTGDVVRFAWRQDFDEWVRDAPKLILDATTAPAVLQQWALQLEVAEIEVRAPRQRVRQVTGREFGRRFFTENPNNVGHLADLATLELAEASGGVLVVAQQAVESALAEELRRRVADGRLPEGGDGMPAGLHLAHHGALTGLNTWDRVERVVVVGRPAMNRREGERLAEVVGGRAVQVVAEDGSRWPTVAGGIRLADGTGAAVQQPRHPDPLVEGLRWSITEGAVLQAIGRGRGVRRAVRVTLLAELALPLTVAEAVGWDEARPDRLTVAAAEAALTGRALPLAPADLAAARPDLWPSANAADLDLTRARKGGQTLIVESYKGLTPLSGLRPARYRKAGGRGSLALALVPAGDVAAARDALEARVGALAAFEPVAPPPITFRAAQVVPAPAQVATMSVAPSRPLEPAAMPPEPPADEPPGLPPEALGMKRLRPMLSPVVDSLVVHRPGAPLVLRGLRYPQRVAHVLLPPPEPPCQR